MTVTGDDLMSMAKTIYGEARGELIFRARVMVGQVIMNRVRKGGWWGNTISEVCQKPYQFSCWNLSDPNRKVIDRPANELMADPAFLECLGIAALLVSERKSLPADFKAEAHVKAVTHYCTLALLEKKPPSWAKGRMHDFAVGNHAFFSNVE